MIAGLARGAEPAGAAVSGAGAAADRHQPQLPGRLGADGPGHGRAGHRTADERHRQPRLHQFREQCRRFRADHPDLLAGHGAGHRAGAGAEQAAARAAAAAAGSAAVRHPRQQAGAQLPHRAGIHLHRQQHEQRGSHRLRRHQPARPAESHQGRRRRHHLRLAVRHAHLGGPVQAEQLRAHHRRRGDGHPRAERAGVGGPDRRPARGAGPGDQRQHHRPDAPVDARPVPQHPAARQSRRLAGARRRRGARRARIPRATSATPSTTASRPRAWPSVSPPARTRSRPSRASTRPSIASRRSSRAASRSSIHSTPRRSCAPRSRRWSRRCSKPWCWCSW